MILAVIGMCGAGKSAACKYLEKKSFQGIYFGYFTLAELKKNNMGINPKNERVIRENLRSKYGEGAFAKLAAPRLKNLCKSTNKIYIDGLYSWSEYLILRDIFKHALKLVQVYADKEIRYFRLSHRKERPLTPKEAESRDIAEIENLAKGGPIAFCDHLILNNESHAQLHCQLDTLINHHKIN